MAKKKTKRASGKAFVPCVPKYLPTKQQRQEAALLAIQYNPVNRPAIFVPKDRLAVLTSKYWQPAGHMFTVGFPFDQTPADVQKKIVEYLNKWSATANVSFVLSSVDPEVRIAREDDGYWSYLGVDILSIPRNQPTMNLQGFTMRTPEAEWNRVVPHEAGHTLGFPHEHMRKQIVDRLDANKTIAWGRRELGWDRNTVIQQILTPVSESSIMGTPNADEDSIMCYQLPGSITKDGRPIRGGAKITDADAQFISTIYPSVIGPPPPPPPPGGKWSVIEQTSTRIVLEASTPPPAPPTQDGTCGDTGDTGDSLV